VIGRLDPGDPARSCRRAGREALRFLDHGHG
jgi:hypothetical protein